MKAMNVRTTSLVAMALVTLMLLSVSSAIAEAKGRPDTPPGQEKRPETPPGHEHRPEQTPSGTTPATPATPAEPHPAEGPATPATPATPAQPGHPNEPEDPDEPDDPENQTGDQGPLGYSVDPSYVWWSLTSYPTGAYNNLYPGAENVPGGSLVNFDDIPLPSDTYRSIVNYAGITWDSGLPDYWGSYRGGWYVYNKLSYATPVSPPNYAFNGYGAINPGFNFASQVNFDGAYFMTTGAGRDVSAVRFVGYVSGVPTYYSEWLSLSSTPAYLSANFLGVDRVVVETQGSGWFAMDDLTYTLAPITITAWPTNYSPIDLYFRGTDFYSWDGNYSFSITNLWIDDDSDIDETVEAGNDPYQMQNTYSSEPYFSAVAPGDSVNLYCFLSFPLSQPITSYWAWLFITAVPTGAPL